MQNENDNNADNCSQKAELRRLHALNTHAGV